MPLTLNLDGCWQRLLSFYASLAQKGGGESCAPMQMLGGWQVFRFQFNLSTSEGCSQSSFTSSSYLGAHTTASASIFLFSVSRFITFLLVTWLPSYLWDNNSSLLCEGAFDSFLSLSTGNGPITVVLGFECTLQPRGRFVKPWLAASPPRVWLSCSVIEPENLYF